MITVTPAVLTLMLGSHVLGKITASAPNANLKATSTCYTEAGSPKDILKVTGINTQTGAKHSTYTMDLRAQNVGKCTVTFTSGADKATVRVVVEKESP